MRNPGDDSLIQETQEEQNSTLVGAQGLRFGQAGNEYIGTVELTDTNYRKNFTQNYASGGHGLHRSTYVEDDNMSEDEMDQLRKQEEDDELQAQDVLHTFSAG